MEDELQGSLSEMGMESQGVVDSEQQEQGHDEENAVEVIDSVDEVENLQESSNQVTDSANADDVILVDATNATTAPGKDVKSNGLPLARIRALINADSDVAIVSKAAVILVARATELFIAQLSSDAARHISSTKRKTIQLKDIAAIIEMCDEYAFLDGINLVETNNQPKSSSAQPPSTTPPLEEITAESSNPQEEVVAE